MNRILKNRKTDLWVLVIAMAMIFGVSGNAVAQSGSFYLGASGGIERANIEHAKTVDSTNVPASYLQSGNIYSTSDSASKTGFSGGLLAGYRLTLDPSDTFYLGVEIDGQFHGGTVSGTLPGDGESEGRNQYGEAWPDEWSVERKNSYGVTLVFGASPPFLISLLGPGAGFYALGGVRRLDAELKVDYSGCPTGNAICTSPEEFTSGTNSYDETFYAWTAGGGLEKMIGDKIGLRGEVRYTQYGKEDRDTFSESEVKVPISLDGSETGFSVKAVLYF
ncbi:MAG: outer membrane beta-barrel protein [Candidatus Dadabacteria bacterium]|nr:outer membrane beta-barrel protein [Candidatus Dadabacteria bacterium]MYI73182.1 outer membrane beta-barrel protein [Candidatus Dadabacteria bacterium]